MGGRRGKKKRSTSKSKKAWERKVGVVCCSSRDSKDGYFEIKIYVVDMDRELGSPGVVEHCAPATPAVRFIFPVDTVLPGVCVLNSTVYIFGGYDPFPWSPTRVKFAKKFVLSDEVLAQGDCLVKEAELADISVMHHAKGLPRAVLTPDRKKIVVFSVYVSVEDSSRAFELYDSDSGTWEELPGLPWTCDHPTGSRHCFCGYWIQSYGFVGKSRLHFYVETEFGKFALNFVHKKWSACGIPSIPEEGFFVTAKDQYLLTTKRVYDLYDGEGFLLENTVVLESDFVHGPPFPLSTFGQPSPFDYSSMVPLPPFLVDGGQVCNTCILRGRTNAKELAARILIDVCHTNLATLETTVSKCASLRIDFLESLHAINLISI